MMLEEKKNEATKTQGANEIDDNKSTSLHV